MIESKVPTTINKFEVSTQEVKTLSDTPYQIKRLIHLSDLHLTNNRESKKEYLGVFINLIKTITLIMGKYCNPADQFKLTNIEKKAIRILSNEEDSTEKSNKPFSKSSLIFVTGDMVSNGNTYNVDTMIFLRNIFRALNLLCYTIVISGNHEYLYTQNSQEGITSLTGDYPYLYFLKYSGNYIFNNIYIHNFSVYDKKLANLDVQTNKIRVGVYHGQINVDTPRETTQIEYKSLPACTFQGCNIILAGDKHTHCYGNKEKTIGYPGSLIQQNIKEGTEKGFLIWHLKDLTSEFVAVKNDYCITRFIFKDNKLINQPYIANKNKVYIKYIDSDYNICEKIVQEHVKNNGGEIVKITPEFETEKQLDNVNQNPPHLQYIEPQFHSSDAYSDLLLKYNDLQPDKKNDEYMNEILKINREMYATIKKIPLRPTKNKSYIPLRLFFSDFLAFRQYNLLDFTKLNGIINIRGKNGLGKTSLATLITYSIHSRTGNYENARDIVNKHTEGKLFTCIELQQDTDIFMIIRIRAGAYKQTKNKKHTNDLYNIKTSVKLLKFDKEAKEYKPYKPGAKDEEIENDITNLFGEYNELENLYFMLDKDRNFLSMKTATDSFTYWMRYFNLQIFDLLYAETSKQIDFMKKTIKTLLEELESKSNENITNEIKRRNLEFTELTNQKKNLEEEIIATSTEIRNIQVQMISLKYTDTSREKLLKMLKLTQTELTNNTNEKILIEKTKTKLTNDINELEQLYQNNINSIDTYLNNQITQKSKSTIKSLMHSNNEYHTKISTHYQEIIQLNDNLKKNINIGTSLLTKRDEIQKSLNGESYAEKIHELENIYENLLLERQTVEKEILKTNTILTQLNTSLNEYNKILDKYNSYTKLVDLYQYYAKLVTRNGIPSLIMKNSFGAIENTINDILSIFSNIKIRIQIECGKEKGRKYDMCPHIKIYRVDSGINMISASSGYSVLINLAIRFAIIKYFNIKAIDCIYFDEVFSSLDIEKIGKLDELYIYIQKLFPKIFIISHSPLIADKNNQIIEISETVENCATSYLTNNEVCKEEIKNTMDEIVNKYVLGIKKIDVKKYEEEAKNMMKKKAEEKRLREEEAKNKMNKMTKEFEDRKNAKMNHNPPNNITVKQRKTECRQTPTIELNNVFDAEKELQKRLLLKKEEEIETKKIQKENKDIVIKSTDFHIETKSNFSGKKKIFIKKPKI